MQHKHLANRIKKVEAILAEKQRKKREAAIELVRYMVGEAWARALGRDGLLKLKAEGKRRNILWTDLPLDTIMEYFQEAMNRYKGTSSDPWHVLTGIEIVRIFMGNL
jgi:hypothetical protein